MVNTITLAVTSETYHLSASQLAARLAKDIKAKLIALYISPDPRAAVPFIGEGLTAETIQTLCDAAERQATKNKVEAEIFFEDLKREFNLMAPNMAEFQVHVGNINEHVGRKARVSDLAVCTQPHADCPDAQDILSDLLFKSGRLILMVPRECTTLGRHAAIAWNGRTECARAVGASIPLLKRVDQVSMIQIGDIDNERPTIEDAADYLKTAGINADIMHEEHTGGPVAEQVHKKAEEIGADHLIIGAYSHARWREMILGGATRWLVLNSKLPVLMSH